MAKKRIEISDLIIDSDETNAFVASVTHAPVLKLVQEPKDDSFDIEPVLHKIGKVKKERKKRNITKPLGRPVVFKEDEKRVNFNTMIRQSFVVKIKKRAFDNGCTNADIIDDILRGYFAK